MKKPFIIRESTMKSFLAGKIAKIKAAEVLGCTTRTIENYRKLVLEKGFVALTDHRHSNHIKLTPEQKELIRKCKETDRWRTARNIRDKLSLPVDQSTVRRVIIKAGLGRENLIRVKPIIRFEANFPNELWQTDIMGRIDFPNLGACYLIATLDDYSRFVPAGKWFKTQGKMNVFSVWYDSLSRWGLPDKMLQDEGSQYKARTRFGQADYQWYANALKIELIWAYRAQTKGKIERFWRFVQDDFVREVWQAKNLEEVNISWRMWLAKYNYVFKSRYFGNVTHASKYRGSKRRVAKKELETLLIIEERRKVTRESTVSLYGRYYYVPPGYIGCRIWVKVIGKRVIFEAMGKEFGRQRLKLN
ncbi:transposase [Candidatus Gottesmanbacteria bacterium]|nr:transposase [Candidatus Gottesmanbacteria bacterium]